MQSNATRPVDKIECFAVMFKNAFFRKRKRRSILRKHDQRATINDGRLHLSIRAVWVIRVEVSTRIGKSP